jgi:hypothetical protein
MARRNKTETINSKDVLTDNVLVYPNPANGFVNIESVEGFGANATFTLMDLNGRTVFEIISDDQQNNLLQLETAGLKQGFYMLLIQGAQGTITKKISIMH